MVLQLEIGTHSDFKCLVVDIAYRRVLTVDLLYDIYQVKDEPEVDDRVGFGVEIKRLITSILPSLCLIQNNSPVKWAMLATSSTNGTTILGQHLSASSTLCCTKTL